MSTERNPSCNAEVNERLSRRIVDPRDAEIASLRAEVERLTKERDTAIENDRVGTLFMLKQTEDLVAAQTRLANLTLELARTKASDEHHFGILQAMHDVLCTSGESHSMLPGKLLRLQQSLLSEKQVSLRAALASLG